MKCRSLWHSPAKAVRSSTSRGPGLLIATSSIVSGWFAAWNTAAFIGPLLSLSSHEVEAQARLRPVRRRQPPGGGEGYISGLHVGAAEADVGRVDIRHRDLADEPAVRGDDRD